MSWVPPNVIVRIGDAVLYASSSSESTLASSDSILLPTVPVLQPPNFLLMAAKSNTTWSQVQGLLGAPGNDSRGARVLSGVTAQRIESLLARAQPGQQHLYDMATHLLQPTTMLWYHWLLLAVSIIGILGVCACFRLYELVPPLYRGAQTMADNCCKRPSRRRQDGEPVSSRELDLLAAAERAAPRVTSRLTYVPDF